MTLASHRYAATRWTALTRYLQEHPANQMDNNAAERRADTRHR
jgi:hypothetical protein